MVAAAKAYEDAQGNVTAAAASLNIPRSTFRGRYQAAERKNFTGNVLGGPTLKGFAIKRVSTYYDAEEGINGQWVIQEKDAEQLQSFIEAIKAEFVDIVRPSPVAPPPFVLVDRMTTYPVVDHHWGMYSWAKETGQNYDMDIARRALLGTVTRLIQDSPQTERALLLGVGDWFHMDNNNFTTERSNNHLDGDTRYVKVLMNGISVWKELIELAKLHHRFVTIRILRGNHDDRGAFILALALAEAYQNDPRVEVDLDPSLFFFYEFGECMIGAHHGHTVKAKEFPGRMAAIKPEMWGRTKFRYAYSGHYHKVEKGPSGGEDMGVEWEQFQASAARDAWNAEMGFTSGRSMTSIVLDKHLGEVQRFRAYIKGE